MFQTLNAFLQRWMPWDKAVHALAGLVLFCLVLLVTGNRTLAILITVAVAALKEAYDAQHRAIHTPDPRDFLFTAAPGLIGWALTGLPGLPLRL
jgi:hypothetical protein